MYLHRLLHLVLLIALTVFPLDLFLKSAQADAGTTLQGEVELLFIENEDFNHSQMMYRLHLDDEESITLFFLAGDPVGLKSGMRISVSGEEIRNESGARIGFWVNDFEFLETAGVFLPLTNSGNRSVLVLKVNFTDGNHSCSLADIETSVFGAAGIAAYYNDISAGSLTFEDDTNGDTNPDVIEVNIAHSISENCNDSFYTNLMNWTNAADTAAQGMGYNPSNYQHVMYYLPSGSSKVNCAWAGLGSFNCSTNCRSWSAYSCSVKDIMAHELGHNIGFAHASFDTNTNGVYDSSSDCEYCDVSSIMGYGGFGLRFLNAPNMDYMGWIPSSRIQEPAADGTYNIAALDTQSPASLSPAVPAETQYLKIAHSTAGDYFISYRRDDGGDFTAGLTTDHAPKVHVHFADNDTYLGRSIQLAILDNGESFSVDGQFRLSSVSINDTYASIVLDLDGAGGDSGSDSGGDSGSSGGSGSADPTPTPTPTPTPGPGDVSFSGSLLFKGKVSSKLKSKLVEGRLLLSLVNLETSMETAVTINPEDFTFSAFVPSGAYNLVATREKIRWWKKKGLSVRPRAPQAYNLTTDVAEVTLKVKRRRKKK